MFDKIITVICYLVLVFFMMNEFHHLYWTPVSVAKDDLYKHHYSLSWHFPFIGSYFLMKPEGYDPRYKYPLVVALHGISKRVYAAEYLSTPEFRNKYRAFVLIPIAPKRAFWEKPENDQYALPQFIPYPDHMPNVMTMIRAVKKRYTIDDQRLYITGHSMGGMGALGALRHYPDTFAAALVLSGTWDPMETGEIITPLWLFHGAEDLQIPVRYARDLASAMTYTKKDIHYTELSGKGHGIWKTVYKNPSVWDWMFSQKKRAN